MACKLASECKSKGEILKRYAIEKVGGGIFRRQCCASLPGNIVVSITVSICLTAIALLANLGNRKIEVRGDWRNGNGSMTIQ